MAQVRSLILFALMIVASNASDVMELSDEDFQNKVDALENTLVMFYAPWCGHCKKLKPEFERAASLMKDDDPPITLAKIDCTEAGKETCNAQSVSGYPTLKIFKNGELFSDYNGPRDASGIVKYMRSQVGPSSKELSSVKDFEAFISKDEVAVVAFFKKDSKIEKTFSKVADKLREKSRFGYTSDANVIENANQKEDTIVLYRPKMLANIFEPEILVYDGAIDKNDIEKWINTNYYGLVGIRTQDNSKDFKHPVVIVYYNVDYQRNKKGTNYRRNRILKVAKDYPEVSFAISNKDEFQYEMNEYGIDYLASDNPVVTAKDVKGSKYIMQDDFSVENLHQFVKKFLAGELEAFLKSESVPDTNDGPVKIAVAKNFDEVVINNGKDTLVEFYAPWCGHCKKLAPVFDELGEKMKGEEVSIVKMDATANDVPSGFEVRGFPTLFWLTKDKKSKPVKYESGRELDDFVKYIAKHASSELKGYDRSGKAKKSEL